MGYFRVTIKDVDLSKVKLNSVVLKLSHSEKTGHIQVREKRVGRQGGSSQVW